MRENASYVYFIGDGRHLKIGVSNNPKKRLKQLQTGYPSKLQIVGIFIAENRQSAFEDEGGWHEYLDDCRESGEWFSQEKVLDKPGVKELLAAHRNWAQEGYGPYSDCDGCRKCYELYNMFRFHNLSIVCPKCGKEWNRSKEATE